MAGVAQAGGRGGLEVDVADEQVLLELGDVLDRPHGQGWRGRSGRPARAGEGPPQGSGGRSGRSDGQSLWQVLPKTETLLVNCKVPLESTLALLSTSFPAGPQRTRAMAAYGALAGIGTVSPCAPRDSVSNS